MDLEAISGGARTNVQPRPQGHYLAAGTFGTFKSLVRSVRWTWRRLRAELERISHPGSKVTTSSPGLTDILNASQIVLFPPCVYQKLKMKIEKLVRTNYRAGNSRWPDRKKRREYRIFEALKHKRNDRKIIIKKWNNNNKKIRKNTNALKKEKIRETKNWFVRNIGPIFHVDQTGKNIGFLGELRAKLGQATERESHELKISFSVELKKRGTTATSGKTRFPGFL
jgi:hypothetical protein